LRTVANNRESKPMGNQTATASKMDQLPEAARDRIEQLRLLFIERSKENLAQIRQLLDARKTANDPRSIDEGLMTLAHSLVGASGIFGFPELGDKAFRVEATLRSADYQEADFAEVTSELIEQLALLG